MDEGQVAFGDGGGKGGRGDFLVEPIGFAAARSPFSKEPKSPASFLAAAKARSKSAASKTNHS
jgi:hypothetical protein